jgi:hypothetical protein
VPPPRRPAGRPSVAGTVAAGLLLAGCAAGPVPGPVPSTTGPVPTTTVPVPTSAVPVAVPGELALGAVELGRPAAGTVEVRPARRPVSFGRTELRGSGAWELTGDTCSGRTLRPVDPPCRLEVTVLGRSTGDLAAKLVLPWDRGTLAVPVRARIPVSYTVTLTVRGGRVTGDRGGLDCRDRCTARVALGTVLTLTAEGGPPRWGGDCAGTAPTCRVTVSAPRAVSADFG